MSCGCGSGNRLPAKIVLRMEAVRLSQDASSRLDAGAVYAFLTEGIDVAALDTPPAPVAVGAGHEAVTSRSALLNAPIQRVAALDRKAVAALVAAAGSMPLGSLAQYDARGLSDAAGEPAANALAQDLHRYGLRLGMTTDDLRAWVIEG